MNSTFSQSEMRPFGVLIAPQGEPSPVADLPVDQLRDLVRRHHLVVLRGFVTFGTADSFAEYCAHWGEVSLWPFGKVLELVEQDKPEDHIFDNNYVPLHWDGMYRPQVPEFQMFHCVSAPEKNQGGRTTFSNTKLALERTPSAARALWSKVVGVYHRKMEFYDSQTVAPIITEHPVSGFPVIRYNEPPRDGDTNFLNHPKLEFKGVSVNAIVDFHKGLCETLYSSENFYAHRWQTGDIVVSDNYTLLHGREAFSSGAPRHLRRVHVLGQPPLNNPHLVSHS